MNHTSVANVGRTVSKPTTASCSCRLRPHLWYWLLSLSTGSAALGALLLAELRVHHVSCTNGAEACNLSLSCSWRHAGIRINNEEQTLAREFGEEWSSYCGRTWRLLPCIW